MNISDKKIIDTLLHQHQKVFFCLSQHLTLIHDATTLAETKTIVKDTQALISTTVEGMQLLANFSDAKDLAKIPCKQFSILAAINETIKIHQQKLNGYKVAIEGEDVTLFGNRYLIIQALSILFENAIKYRHTERNLLLNWKVEQKDDCIQISLRDNGIGLPTNNTKRIFEWGTKSRQNPSIPGMGIGLNLAQSIVTAHNGKILATNHTDGGAIFIITIPNEGLKCENS